MTGKLGSLIIDLEGKDLTSEERELLAHPLVGGVILFTRNEESRRQLKHLCQQIRSSCKNPLLIMVDQEGGRVQRFSNEFTRLPCMGHFGKIYDENPDTAGALAKDCGRLMATELLSVGIDFSLAPVLDLNKGMNTVIGERAFHSDPQVVIHLAKSFIQGMQVAGMASVGKHFPGHGSVTLDSHVTIPIDERSLSAIEQEDMKPFEELIKMDISGVGMTGIMAAHIQFPNVDKLAVGFSHRWLQDILRAHLRFTGPIFTDDLNMEGANISADYADRVAAARDAGCDFALLCNNRHGVIQVLDNLPYAAHQVSKDKWSVLQGQFSLN